MKQLSLILLGFIFVYGGDEISSVNISFDGRGFYFDRAFDNDTPNAKAFTLGGIAKIETQKWNGFDVGVGYYASFLLPSITSRDEAMGTGLVDVDGENLSFLGEAYLSYEFSDTLVRAGRQRLQTPLANDHDLRMLPSTYEALIVQNRTIDKLMLEFGYIYAYSGFVSKYNSFEREFDKWGESGIGYAYLTYKIDEKLSYRLQYARTIENKSLSDNKPIAFGYGDVEYAFLNDLQSVIKLQSAFNEYKLGDNSWMFGALAKNKIGIVNLDLLFNAITGNEIRAIESGSMYSDWQQGYGNYEPSYAFGFLLSSQPTDTIDIKLGAVSVTPTDGYITDDFTEYMLDASYKFNPTNRLRLRFSYKDQTPESLREDRSDFRLIYYYSFKS